MEGRSFLCHLQITLNRGNPILRRYDLHMYSTSAHNLRSPDSPTYPIRFSPLWRTIPSTERRSSFQSVK